MFDFFKGVQPIVQTIFSRANVVRQSILKLESSSRSKASACLIQNGMLGIGELGPGNEKTPPLTLASRWGRNREEAKLWNKRPSCSDRAAHSQIILTKNYRKVHTFGVDNWSNVLFQGQAFVKNRTLRSVIKWQRHQTMAIYFDFRRSRS